MRLRFCLSIFPTTDCMKGVGEGCLWWDGFQFCKFSFV